MLHHLNWTSSCSSAGSETAEVAGADHTDEAILCGDGGQAVGPAGEPAAQGMAPADEANPVSDAVPQAEVAVLVLDDDEAAFRARIKAEADAAIAEAMAAAEARCTGQQQQPTGSQRYHSGSGSGAAAGGAEQRR